MYKQSVHSEKIVQNKNETNWRLSFNASEHTYICT